MFKTGGLPGACFFFSLKAVFSSVGLPIIYTDTHGHITRVHIHIECEVHRKQTSAKSIPNGVSNNCLLAFISRSFLAPALRNVPFAHESTPFPGSLYFLSPSFPPLYGPLPPLYKYQVCAVKLGADENHEV